MPFRSPTTKISMSSDVDVLPLVAACQAAEGRVGRVGCAWVTWRRKVVDALNLDITNYQRCLGAAPPRVPDIPVTRRMTWNSFDRWVLIGNGWSDSFLAGCLTLAILKTQSVIKYKRKIAKHYQTIYPNWPRHRSPKKYTVHKFHVKRSGK